MKFKNLFFFNYLLIISQLGATEAPRLPESFDKPTYTVKDQQKLDNLKQAYFSTTPEDLNDGLEVGSLKTPNSEAAIQAFLKDDQARKYSNLDSLLIWKEGKLIFEMYNRKGRVDAPHYTMSITKTLSSIALARAIQCGYLSMADLDKNVIDFMPKIDRTKIQKGTDSITLRDVLMMKSGIRLPSKKTELELANKYKKQDYFQKLFEKTAPISSASKTYKYSGLNPTIVLGIIDIRVPGSVQDFIRDEVAAKIGATYNWKNQNNGLPSGGAGANFTSRSLIKIAASLMQGGKYHGDQWLSPEYVQLIMDTSKGEGYFYYFHNRVKFTKAKKVNFISGIGAGGQYMSTYPDHGIAIVATSTKSKKIGAPLNAIGDHLIKLFEK